MSSKLENMFHFYPLCTTKHKGNPDRTKLDT